MRLSNLSNVSAFALITIAGWFGLVAYAVLIGTSLLGERQDRIAHARVEVQNITRVLDSQAMATIQKVDLVMSDVLGHVSAKDVAAVQDPTAHARRVADLHRLLAAKLAEIPEADVIHVANANGDYVYSSLDPVPAINIADREFFLAHKAGSAGQTVISAPLQSRTLGTWVITASRAVTDEDGRFVGVVNVIIQLSNFEKFFQTIDMGPHGAVLMRDGQMRLMARYPPLESNMGVSMPNHPAARLIAKGQDKGVYVECSPADGVRRMYSFQRVGTYPIYVLAALAEEDYLKDWWAHLYWYSGTGALIAAVVLVLSMVARQGWRRQRATEEELVSYHEHLEQLVTERTQDAQEARNQADTANRSKSDFLANMSHEIRTPLNAVIGLTQLTLDTRLDERQRDYLNKVLSSSRALLGILNDILDYSKIEAGRIDLEAVEFSLEDLLCATADLFCAHAEEKGVELFIDIAPEVPDRLIGDPLRLGQVINNLVGNAVKFTPQGQVHVRIHHENQEHQGDGAITLHVAVRDTGIGISPEQVARLFQPFTQGDATFTRKFGGTGLGLIISKRLVELMQGAITVQTVPNGGSTFSFSIPLRVAAKQNGGVRLQSLKPMRCLVVDDKDTSLLILRSLLESWHFRVSTANGGESALRLFCEAKDSGDPFELLLLDWKMPGMDGVDLVRAIESIMAGTHKRPPTIVMVTAYGRETLLQALGTTVVESILPKPVTSSHLLDTLLHVQSRDVAATVARADVFGAARSLVEGIRNTRILLVEDNEINQQVAREFLTKAGFQVTVANNGLEAVDLVRGQTFDAVLMDLHMPIMDGFESTRRIRALPGGQGLPIIAMTAAAMSQDREACTAAGMNGHIAKPVDPEELAAVLVQWIKPRREKPAAGAAPAPAPVSAPVAMPSASVAPTASQTAHTPPAQPSVDDLEQALPGQSVRAALGRMGSNMGLYRQLLSVFVQGHGDTGAKLRALPQTGDLEPLYEEAHALKGVALSLGLSAVGDTASRLCDRIKSGEGESIPALVAELAQQCDATLAHLRSLGFGAGDTA